MFEILWFEPLIYLTQYNIITCKIHFIEMQAALNYSHACGFRINYSCRHLNPSPCFAFCCIMPDPYPEKDDTAVCLALRPCGMFIWSAVHAIKSLKQRFSNFLLRIHEQTHIPVWSIHCELFHPSSLTMLQPQVWSSLAVNMYVLFHWTVPKTQVSFLSGLFPWQCHIWGMRGQNEGAKALISDFSVNLLTNLQNSLNSILRFTLFGDRCCTEISCHAFTYRGG